MAAEVEVDNLEDEEEEYSEGEEEDEEMEAEEPKLKYQRLGANIAEILNKDAASCMAVHEKFLALGTHYGFIHILDFNGNEINRFHGHTATINELSVDNDGEFIASCSDDGKVVISALYSKEVLEYVYQRPVKSVALDPAFHRKKDSRQFCAGGKAEQLLMNKKGWFTRKDAVIHEGEGTIHAIKWNGSIIAWANDNGVKMYDCRTKQRITYVNRPEGSPRPDLFRCHLCWESETVLLIGWADSVKICKIKEKDRSDVAAGLPTRYVEIIGLFKTDYYISGIAPFKEYLVLLSFMEEDVDGKGTKKAGRPELRVVTRNNVEISSDALSVHSWEHYHANDYRLEHMPSESLFYVVSPKDIIVARPRDLDDHITWLLQHEKYEEALTAAEEGQAQLRFHKIDDIGEKMLEHLIQRGEVKRAASMCPKVLKQDAVRWEKWIFCFADISHLRAIVPYIPIQDPQLGKTVYEMVLSFFLLNDHEGFLRVIREWPHDRGLYNTQTIIEAVVEALKDNRLDLVLKDALAELYTYDKMYDKALDIYLRLKRGDVFGLIEKHNLFNAIKDKIVLLMEFDKAQAIKMLIDNCDRIPIKLVVDQLSDRRQLQHEYLHELFVKDAHIGKDFHKLQVSLYADFDYKQLLPFLKQSSNYPLEEALDVCTRRNFYPEMVFILGRMGNNKDALDLIIRQIRDVEQAIEFVQTTNENDDELWEDLIEKSINNPDFVGGLLEHIGGHVDPIQLIQRIPNGMEIPGLRGKIIKIITDYNLQMSLRDGCKEILKHDCVVLAQDLHARNRRGICVSESKKCAMCTGDVIASKGSDVVVFFCGHVFHKQCISVVSGPGGAPSLHCAICRNENKKRGGLPRSGGAGARTVGRRGDAFR